MKNPQFFVDGELSFPCVPERPDGFYRTVFGPSVAHNAVIYARTNQNMKLALRRLTAVRAPEVPGYDKVLFRNQALYINKNLKKIKIFSFLYSSYFESYQNAETEAMEHYDDPHIKRALRIQAYKKLHDTNQLVDQSALWQKTVEAKFKPEEYAKNSKYGRVIGDYGVEASLLGFRLTDFLKTAMSSEDVELHGGVMRFCKSPDPVALKKHFENLLDPVGDYFFLFFSDDSCLSIRDKRTGEVHRYNLDISSCDRSHGPSIFRLFVELFPIGAPRDDALRLVAQCMLPVLIRSYGVDQAFVILRCCRPFLYSGSTITTGINNLACMLICMSITEEPYQHRLDADGNNLFIIEAAARVGYILSGCKPLGAFEEVQFLKNSPVLDIKGQWQPMLNFGVLLRASGTCRGDLPGRGDFRERARSFQAGLLQGCYPKTEFEVLTVMRAATKNATPVIPDEVKQLLAYKTCDSVGSSTFRVDPESFCRRYKLTQQEYFELLHDFAPCGFGYSYHGASVSKILSVDYDLATVELNPAPFLCISYNSASTEALL